MWHSLLCAFFLDQDPWFITCNHILQEISITWDSFRMIKTHVLLIILLLHWHIMKTILAHNFLMAKSCVKICWTVVWLKFNSLAIIRTESTVWPNKCSHFLHIVINFLSWIVSRMGFIFNGFTAVWNCLITLEHLWSQQSMLPIDLIQFIESFNAGFHRFDTKLDCTSLLEIALSHFCDTHTHTHTHTQTAP
jgi:hypothetical protein